VAQVSRARLINSDISAGPGSGPSNQFNWYYGTKCFTMAANKNQGVCPATGSAKKAHTSG
jgi:hypothetical protein